MYTTLLQVVLSMAICKANSEDGNLLATDGERPTFQTKYYSNPNLLASTDTMQPHLSVSLKRRRDKTKHMKSNTGTFRYLDGVLQRTGQKAKGINLLKQKTYREDPRQVFTEDVNRKNDQSAHDSNDFRTTDTKLKHSETISKNSFYGTDKKKLKNSLPFLMPQKGSESRETPNIWSKDKTMETNNLNRQAVASTFATKQNTLIESLSSFNKYGSRRLPMKWRVAVMPIANISHEKKNREIPEKEQNDISKYVQERNVVARKRAHRQFKYVNHRFARHVLGPITDSKCKIEVKQESRIYFKSRLISKQPDFIQFSLDYNNKQMHFLHEEDVFQAKRWFWTYNSTSGPFPFLAWDLDYGILSFHLLEAKTINVPEVSIEPNNSVGQCDNNYKFGEKNTSEAIASALVSLINVTEGEDFFKYPENYFCFLSTRQELIGTFHYWAAIYFRYPINFIYYKCCSVTLHYGNNKFKTKCEDKNTCIKRYQTWTITNKLPYNLGILLLLYFPVMFLKMTAWLAKDERIHEDVEMYEMAENFECISYADENWIFADGNSPITIGELLSFKRFGLGKYPVLTSRLRRLLFLLSFPVLIYLQVAMYSEGMGLWSDEKIKVKDLVKVGTPMGFLSILGDPDDRQHVFVPLLGGPVGVVLIYYMLSFLFIALPRSVKQVIEDGLPSTNLLLNSPLFFGTNEIITMSMIEVTQSHLKPGYTKAVTLMKCRFYMLFTRRFWSAVCNIQVDRFLHYFQPDYEHRCCNIIMVSFILPIYGLFCAFEAVCCIVFHGVPFCSFISISFNGSVKSLSYLREQSVNLSTVFSYRLTAYIGGIFIFILFMIYMYVISLEFVISFVFIFQVITYCFVAIIIYPSVSFGYLFFFIVLMYYFIKLVRNFGDGYMELLEKTVDISRNLSEDIGKVQYYEGELSISNVRVENLNSVRINGKLLSISPEILRSLRMNASVPKVKEKHSSYGVPKILFDNMVRKHRPIHQQVLILLLKAAIMITFIILTLAVTSNYVIGPTTEISEVMHVIFIVALGAIPQLVQAVISRSDTVLAREIEEGQIRKSIIDFWNKEAGKEEVRELYEGQKYQDY